MIIDFEALSFWLMLKECTKKCASFFRHPYTFADAFQIP